MSCLTNEPSVDFSVLCTPQIDENIFDVLRWDMAAAGHTVEESMRVLQEMIGQNVPVFWIVSAVTVVLGLIACFFGYRLKKLWTGFLGLIAGFLAGFLIGRMFLESVWLCIGIGVLAAVVLAVLAFCFYQAGVFLVCASVMFFVIKVLFHGEDWWVYLISALAAAAAGVAGICFVKPVFAIATGFGGAFAALQAVWEMAGLDVSVLLYAAVLVLGICGVIVQLSFAGKKEETDRQKNIATQKAQADSGRKKKKQSIGNADADRDQRERHKKRRQSRRNEK